MALALAIWDEPRPHSTAPGANFTRQTAPGANFTRQTVPGANVNGQTVPGVDVTRRHLPSRHHADKHIRAKLMCAKGVASHSLVYADGVDFFLLFPFLSDCWSVWSRLSWLLERVCECVAAADGLFSSVVEPSETTDFCFRKTAWRRYVYIVRQLDSGTCTS